MAARALPTAEPRPRRLRPGWVRSGPHRSRTARGAVSAETAAVLPVLLAVTVALVWLISLTVAQIRVVDAARETARAVARDDPSEQAVALGRRVAPSGARVEVHRSEGVVRVQVSAEVAGPGGLLGFLPGVEVDAEAVAAREGR